MLEAVGKTIDVLSSQLNGDRPKLEKAVNDSFALYDKILFLNPANIKALNGNGSAKEMLAAVNDSENYKKALELTTSSLAENDKDVDAHFRPWNLL